jgi:mono/diheme cytochrome c family protein
MSPATRSWPLFLALSLLLLAASGRAQKSSPTDVLTISMPGDATVLEFDSPGFMIVRNETNEDGSQDFSAVNKDARMTLAILLRRAPSPATPEGCRDSLEQQAKKQSGAITDVHFSELNGVPSVEYSVRVDRVVPDEKSVVVCLTRANDYAIVRLAITAFQPENEKKFSEILKRIRFAGPAEAAPDAPPPASSAGDNSLVAQGQSLFKTYKCHECHGPHGEGTDDAPDLIGTRLNAAEIAAFIQKPSAHARSVGMPSLAADSPDLQPLVAFVLTLKHSVPAR